MADDQLPPLVQPVTVDLTGLLEGLAKSKHAAEEHNDFWKHAGEVFSGIVGVEFSEAIKDMVKEAVNDFAKLDQAFDTSARTLSHMGGTYVEAREKVEKYAESVESLTQFTKVEAVTSLNNVLNKTQDWTASLKLNGLAMDIVARDPTKNLLSISNSLALAFQGNSRGLMQVSRELGIVGPAAKDAGELFTELEKRFKGAAVETNNVTSELTKLKNEMEKISEEAGSKLAPIITDFSKTLRAQLGNKEAGLEISLAEATEKVEGLKKALIPGSLESSVLHWTKKAADDAAADVTRLTAELKKLRDTLPGGGSVAAQAAANQKKENEEIAAAKEALEMEARKTKFEDEQNKQLQQQGNAKSVILTLDKNRQSILERERVVRAALTDSENKTLALQFVTENDGSKMSLRHLAQLNAERKQTIDLKEELKKLDEERLAFAQTLVGPVASSMETFFTKVREGTASMTQVFEALGKAIAKSLLGALAAYLEQKAAVATAEGLGAMASLVGAAAAPGYFAEAAIEATGAGAIRAVAASLANGAVAMPRKGGHIVQVAEANQPELIVPVDRLGSVLKQAGLAGGMGGKGTVHNNSFNFPGVTKASEVAPIMKTAARQFAETLNRYNISAGLRA